MFVFCSESISGFVRRRFDRFCEMASFKLFVLFVCFALSHTDGATVFRRQRALAETDSTKKPLEICVKSTPCGWAVYHRFTRDIDYFMQNKCKCPEGKKCLRTDDDISVTAYVYRCKDPQKDTDNES